ncbi:Cytochrome c oxidase polypeptide 5, mitochondrial, partial [Tolypocladium capitatum]
NPSTDCLRPRSLRPLLRPSRNPHRPLRLATRANWTLQTPIRHLAISPKMLRTPASSLLRKCLVRSVPAATASRASSTQTISNPTLANIEKRWEGMPLQEQADLWMALRDRMKGSWAELTVQEKKAGRMAELAVRPQCQPSRSPALPPRAISAFLEAQLRASVPSPVLNWRISQWWAWWESGEAARRKLTQIVPPAYWIAFGPHGPRAADPPGTNARIAWGVAMGLGASLAVFGIVRSFAKPEPRTMSKEYQEASNELLKQQKADPITGIASEGYTGKGQVQSPPQGH